MRDVWARNEGAELRGLAVDRCRDGGETHIVQAPDIVAERPDGRVPQDQVVVGDVCASSEDFAAAHWAWIAHQVPACAVLCRIGLGEAVGRRYDGEVTGCAGGTVSKNGGGGGRGGAGRMEAGSAYVGEQGRESMKRTERERGGTAL